LICGNFLVIVFYQQNVLACCTSSSSLFLESALAIFALLGFVQQLLFSILGLGRISPMTANVNARSQIITMKQEQAICLHS
jgi:hypothetical protein